MNKNVLVSQQAINGRIGVLNGPLAKGKFVTTEVYAMKHVEHEWLYRLYLLDNGLGMLKYDNPKVGL